MLMYSGFDLSSWVASSVWMLFVLSVFLTSIAFVFWLLAALGQKNEQSRS